MSGWGDFVVAAWQLSTAQGQLSAFGSSVRSGYTTAEGAGGLLVGGEETWYCMCVCYFWPSYRQSTFTAPRAPSISCVMMSSPKEQTQITVTRQLPVSTDKKASLFVYLFLWPWGLSVEGWFGFMCFYVCVLQVCVWGGVQLTATGGEGHSIMGRITTVIVNPGKTSSSFPKRSLTSGISVDQVTHNNPGVM